MVRQILRVLAVAGLVGLVTLSPATVARADSVIHPPSIETVGGAAWALAPGVAVRAGTVGAVCATGVGCAALTVGAVVVGAGMVCYEVDKCKDTVIPWVKKKFTSSASGPERCGKLWIKPEDMGWSTAVYPGNANIVFRTTAQRLDTNSRNCDVNLTYDLTVTSASGVKYQVVNKSVPGVGVPKDGSVVAGPGFSYTTPVGAAETFRVTSLVIRTNWINADTNNGPGETLMFNVTAPKSATVGIKCQRMDGSGTWYIVNTVTPDPKEALRMGHCEPGDRIIGTTLDVTDENGVTTREQTLDIRNDPTADAQYPKCAGTACYYRVSVDGIICGELDTACTDWTRIARTTPTRVECWYGPYLVPVDNCYFMERAFEGLQTDTVTGWTPRTHTDWNTDGNPDTKDKPLPVAQPSPSPSPSPTASPPPTAGPTPNPTGTIPVPSDGLCSTPYHLGAVTSTTAAGVMAIAPRFGIKDVGGYREDPIPDHPSGRAADFMTYTDTAKRDAVASFVSSNAGALNVQYVISNQRIWNVDRQAEGWRPMEDRGSDTANHKDHVHVTFKDVAGAVSCISDPGDQPKEKQCWPSGWGVFNPSGWVLQPIRCAFIPSDEAVDTLRKSIETDVKTTGLPDLITAVRAPVLNIPNGGSSCQGPAIRFPKLLTDQGFPSTPMYPVNACDDPIKTAAVIVKAISTVVIVVGGGLAMVRMVGAGFGYNVGFRSGGGE